MKKPFHSARISAAAEKFTAAYVSLVKLLRRHRLVFCLAALLFFGLLGLQMTHLRFNLSDTAWMGAGAKTDSTARTFTVLAFDILDTAANEAKVTRRLIDKMRSIPGIADLEDGRMIGALVRKLSKNVGVVTFDIDVTEGSRYAAFDSLVEKAVRGAGGIGAYHYLGQNILIAELGRMTQKDTVRLLPVAFLIAFGLLILLYRNITATMLPLLNTALTLTGSIGVFSLFGFSAPITITIVPALVLVFCLNDSIYILNAVIEGEGKLREIVLPCLQTGFGILTGMVALMVSGYAPIRSLGEIGRAYV
jgi:predicted RND superfamily exporter protein